MTLTPLVEYLLGVRRATGGPLTRLGVVQVTVPVFPPNTTILYESFPQFGAYVNIEFWWKLSPAMVPGAFQVNITHAGTERAVGAVGAAGLAHGYQVWVEITRQQPIRSQVSNISGLNQFFELQAFFLIIDSQEDYMVVMEEIRRWNERGGK